MNSFKMSADLFRGNKTPTSIKSPLLLSPDSRIPIPGVATFRRSASLRLRGERYNSTIINNNNNHHHHLQQHSQRSTASSVVPATVRRPNNTELTVPGSGAQNNAASNRTRSLSLSLSTPRLSIRGAPDPRTPPTSPRNNTYYLDDDLDLDSLNSYTSLTSTASCDHPFVAHNGTTFSGRKMKYVVHCTSHSGQTGDEYLTPTQRAQKQIKRLKQLLHQAKQDIDQKDSDIFRLTKEVVELRLYKASTSQNSPDESNSSAEAITVKENTTPDSPTACCDNDSGHFDDLDNTSSSKVQMCDKSCLVRFESDEDERQRIIELYEKKLENLIRLHGNETQELKQKHNEKIEELLQRLSDVNLRYSELVPNLEQARERIHELEAQLDDVNKKLQDQEEHQKKLYLQMYNKGIEAAKLEQKEQVMAMAQQTPNQVSVPELLQQLQVTQSELENIKENAFMAENSLEARSLLSAKEALSLWVLGARKAMYRRLSEMKASKSEMDPEVTLQFLKSAIYYFLTDRENNQGHLRAIQSILGFTLAEISNIDKARTS